MHTTFPLPSHLSPSDVLERAFPSRHCDQAWLENFEATMSSREAQVNALQSVNPEVIAVPVPLPIAAEIPRPIMRRLASAGVLAAVAISLVRPPRRV